MTASQLDPGELDPNFGPLKDGILVLKYADFMITNGQLVSEAPNGKIYIAGSSWSQDTVLAEHFSLTRVLSDGTLDHGFGLAGTKHVRLPRPGSDGLGTTPFQIVYLGSGAEGKILVTVGRHVAGDGASTQASYLVRLTDKGELDDSFGNDGILLINPSSEIDSDQSLSSEVMQFGNTSSSRSVHVADGKIYVISAAFEPATGLIARVMCFDNDGKPELSFNGTGYVSLSEVLNVRSSFNDIVVQDGKITVCGWAGSGALLARINTDGGFDKTFAEAGYKVLEGPSFQFTSLAVLPDGRTVAAGFGFSDRRGLLAAYTSGGQIDRTFNQGAHVEEKFDSSDTVMFLGMGFKDGKIIASGRYIDGARTLNFVTARYLANGRRDTTFGKGKGWIIPDIRGYRPLAHGMSMQSDGKILAVGNDHDGFYGRAVIVTRLLNGA